MIITYVIFSLLMFLYLTLFSSFKVLEAQTAGFKGAIVYDDINEGLFPMTGKTCKCRHISFLHKRNYSSSRLLMLSKFYL